MTQSSSADTEQSQLKAGMRPWEPPSMSTVLAAVESSHEDAPFVFHDPAGRRWSRIKRAAAITAAVLLVVGGGVLVAVTRVAPGRAPAFSGAPTQQVPDWQVRDGGAAPGGPVPTAVPSSAGGQSPAAPSARSSTALSPQPSHTRSRRPTPTPRHTPLPPTPTA